ncbi:SET domain-containing [Pyrenophora seminiperda CCB06]|uniref:SET domain-containing n=1 Tax=Pyrenophora seminiperda CCB06 TaxID=1302712 RepID=A0A3M7M1L1_9PLEO|nr:SET domain-containing [Pyrenophora seminiperda CCB06]
MNTRSINADRAQKAELDRQKRAHIYELEQGLHQSGPTTTPLNPTARAGSTQGGATTTGGGGTENNPSVQASQDPAATRHAPEDEAQRAGEKSKYEASEVYRSRKGDRFS